MNDLLFSVEESLSPRLKWMREHGVETMDIGKCASPRWLAYLAHGRLAGSHGKGETEDEALAALAKKLKIQLWNESPGPHVAESDQ